MPIKVGDIDIVEQSLNNEFHILQLEKILFLLASKARISITQEELNAIKAESLQAIQKKYPQNKIQIVTDITTGEACDGNK